MNELKRPLASIGLSVIAGLVLISLGGLWLLAALLHLPFGRILWPFFIIVPGAVLLYLGLQMRNAAGLALTIPGALTTAVGLLLLFASVTGHWVVWAYAWALIMPTSMGLAFMATGTVAGQRELVNAGRLMTWIGLILFAAFALFFEVILGVGGLLGRGVFLGVVLVAGGLALLLYVLLRQRKV